MKGDSFVTMIEVVHLSVSMTTFLLYVAAAASPNNKDFVKLDAKYPGKLYNHNNNH